jgi:hypothetical protein
MQNDKIVPVVPLALIGTFYWPKLDPLPTCKTTSGKLISFSQSGLLPGLGRAGVPLGQCESWAGLAVCEEGKEDGCCVQGWGPPMSTSRKAQARDGLCAAFYPYPQETEASSNHGGGLAIWLLLFPGKGQATK